MVRMGELYSNNDPQLYYLDKKYDSACLNSGSIWFFYRHKYHFCQHSLTAAGKHALWIYIFEILFSFGVLYINSVFSIHTKILKFGEVHSCCAQGLLLTICLGITLINVQGAKCSSGDGTRVRYIQGKFLILILFL